MKAAIFDMNGLLVDSEPLWRQAEKSTFRAVGISLTNQMRHETLGLRPDEAVAYWYGRFPWTGASCEEVETRLLAAAQWLVFAHGQPLPRVYTTLRRLKNASLKLGLASSSPYILIETVVGKLEVRDYFGVMFSAVDEVRGKPDPAVYLTAVEKLGVTPSDCIAFGDSVSGVRSAKSARMAVVAAPANNQYYEQEFDTADLKLRSLARLSTEMVRRFNGRGGA